MPYSPLLVKPFRDELVNTGVQELHTPQDVDNALNQPGTTLVVVNSVCGCAAGTARPAVRMVMENKTGKKPDRIVSVFAGQDMEATARFRSHIQDVPPSSPCFALFKDKELVNFIPKHRIESTDPQSLANYMLEMVQEHA
jgi:putative YphP/YqiW family bacilliredoxin